MYLYKRGKTKKAIKGKRKEGIGIDHHLAAFDDQHSLSLALCLSVGRSCQQMLIIKSKVFGIGLRKQEQIEKL